MPQKNKITRLRLTVNATKMLLLLFAIFWSGCFFAQKIEAETIDNMESSDKKTQEQLEELEKKAQKYREIIEIKQKQKESLSNQISMMDANILKYETEIELNKRKIEELNSQILRKQAEIKDKEENMLHQKKLLGNLLKAVYEVKTRNILAILLLRENLNPFLHEKDRLIQTGEKINEIVGALKSSKQALEEEKNTLEKNRSALSKTHADLEEINNNLESVKSSKEILLSQTQGEEARYQKLLSNINNEIYEIEARKFVNYNNLPAAKGGYFDYPVAGKEITQNYGCLNDSFARASYPPCDNGKGGFHNGVDFGRNSGENIYAVRNGNVVESGNNNNYAYGQWLAIDHGDGLVTLYAHLSSKNVSKGDKVKKGDRIGIMGNTGYSTGTHLHFTVFDKESFELVESKYIKGLRIPTGASVNPFRYL